LSKKAVQILVKNENNWAEHTPEMGFFSVFWDFGGKKVKSGLIIPQ
jgi:hypothetical protein